MKKILIFSGTTEGRRLALILQRLGIACDVAVATDYGASLMEESDYIHILKGRMDRQAMVALFRENDYEAIIDATHPFATLVTSNLIESARECGIKYFRLLRGKADITLSNCRFFDSIEGLIEGLKTTSGKILLTTGSKDLASFCKDEELKKRLIVRVLPGSESIKLCEQNGLEGKQIIAMQGPFSHEMNALIIKEYGIDILVTKESGRIGGEDTKVSACEELGVSCFILRRPDLNENIKTYDMDGILAELSKRLNINIQYENKIYIDLCGIGMGSKELMTYQVMDSIKSADYIFGAKRLLEGINTAAKKEAIYKAKDICERIEAIHKEAAFDVKVLVLFSGDTGFYSACKNVYEAIKKYPYAKPVIMPGISSVSMLSARLAVPYSDALIISLHGKDKSIWRQELIDLIKNNNRLFFLTSGKNDIKDIIFIKNEIDESIKLFLGYNLSYPDERIIKVNNRLDLNILPEGLYVGYIEKE